MGRTSLHYAYLLLNSKSLVKYLLFKGADQEKTDVVSKSSIQAKQLEWKKRFLFLWKE